MAEPAVGSVIRPDERGQIQVYTEDGDVYVRVTARDELVVCAFLGSLAEGPWDAVEKADQLYDRITDDLPLTDFAWGERREGRYRVPGPAHPLAARAG